MKLAKLILATGIFAAMGTSSYAQTAPTTTAAPTSTTGEGTPGHHKKHKLFRCVHKALKAQGLHRPGPNATPEEVTAFKTAKNAAMQKCEAELSTPAPTANH
jgi:hypothetical protein